MLFLLRRLAIRARGQEGFTLVELLVVVAIIAVLAAVLVPRLTGYGNSARISRTMGDLATMRSIIEAYSANEGKGSYPTPSNEETDPASVAAVLRLRGVKWTGDGSGIKDPWGMAYKYDATSDGGSNYIEYVIVSAGPDKDYNTEDDIYTSGGQTPAEGMPDPAPGTTAVDSAI
jgi:general secretion pathway protein G